MTITKKVQQNQHYFKHIEHELRALGFVVKFHIEQNDYCLFGKSLPDLYFYKELTYNMIKVGLLTKVCDKSQDESENEQVGEYRGCSIVDAVAQFKSQSSDLKKFYPQMFCDLVRVGTLRACDAIMRGLIVDKIVVIGLLTNYETEVGVLVKYYIDFITDESVF